MARGVKQIGMEFMLCDVIPIDVIATVRFGSVESIEVSYQGKRLNMDEYLFDDENDFITLEEFLIELAQELYDNPDEIILELE